MFGNDVNSAAFRAQMEELKKDVEEREQNEREDLIQEREEALKINSLYEYKVVKKEDESDGSVNTVSLTDTINRYAKAGWRLVSCYSNELGKNSKSVGIAGFESGRNATIDETILVFERCVQLPRGLD